MKIIMMLFVIGSFAFSKDCYFNKAHSVCYSVYFNKSLIHKPQHDEIYYSDKNGNIFTFDNLLEVKFKSIGAIFPLLKDLELEFIDKINTETYLFKVEHRRDLFPMITKINKLKTVMEARPHKERRYTKAYILAGQEAEKARVKALTQKAQKNKRNNYSSGTSSGSKSNSSSTPKSFLKGELP